MEGCTAHIEAETEEEVMAQAEEHARAAHPAMEFDEGTAEHPIGDSGHLIPTAGVGAERAMSRRF